MNKVHGEALLHPGNFDLVLAILGIAVQKVGGVLEIHQEDLDSMQGKILAEGAKPGSLVLAIREKSDPDISHLMNMQ